MATMCAAHSRNPVRMAGCSKPVVHGGSNATTLDRRFSRTVMTGDQEKHSFAAPDRLLERMVDRRPGGIEVHAVEIQNAVGLD